MHLLGIPWQVTGLWVFARSYLQRDDPVVAVAERPQDSGQWMYVVRLGCESAGQSFSSRNFLPWPKTCSTAPLPISWKDQSGSRLQSSRLQTMVAYSHQDLSHGLLSPRELTDQYQEAHS